jgi:hypothetical protein
MNAQDILKYGHLWVHKHLDGLTGDQWLTPGVCGVWSVKDIVAHLTSFEWVLVEVLSSCHASVSTPTLDQLVALDGDTFNAVQVGKRQAEPASAVLKEYNDSYSKAIEAFNGVDENDLRSPGTLPWYGMEYALDDYIVYQFYGHKREHCAQIDIYRDGLTAPSGS